MVNLDNMDNRQIVHYFFELLRKMIMSIAKNPNDPGEMRELTYLANYIKDMVAEVLQGWDDDLIPLLSLTVSGSRDGKTSGRFMISRNEAIIKAWKLTTLAHMLGDKVTEWDKTLEHQPEEVDFDMTPYQLLKKEIAKKNG